MEWLLVLVGTFRSRGRGRRGSPAGCWHHVWQRRVCFGGVQTSVCMKLRRVRAFASRTLLRCCHLSRELCVCRLSHTYTLTTAQTQKRKPNPNPPFYNVSAVMYSAIAIQVNTMGHGVFCMILSLSLSLSPSLYLSCSLSLSLHSLSLSHSWRTKALVRRKSIGELIED